MQTIAGDQLASTTLGEYRIERQLGRGKVSAVYEACKDGQPDQRVMVTTFLLPEGLSEQTRARFLRRLRETGKALTGLRHPHILPIYACDELSGIPSLVTPFAHGGSLARKLQQGGRFPCEQVVSLARQITSALDYAHQHQVMHGTLSSANILLNDEQTLQVAGFGLLQILQMRDIEQQSEPYSYLRSIGGTLLGNVSTMAPEFVQGAPIDARTDVYALGVILFEMLTGTLPFQRTNPLEALTPQAVPSITTIAPDVPMGLDLVIAQALDADPARRFKSAGDVVAAFERVLSVVRGTGLLPAVGKPVVLDTQTTLPPTMNWVNEDTTTGKLSSLLSGTSLASNTGKTARVLADSSASPMNGNWQITPPIMTGKLAAIEPGQFGRVAEDASDGDEGAIDPFTWWTTSSLADLNGQNAAGASGGPSRRLARPQTARARKRPPTYQQQRRQVVALVAGTVVIGGIGIVGGLKLAQSIQQRLHPNTATVPNTAATTGGTTPTAGTQVTPGSIKGNKQTPTAASTATPAPTKAAPTPTPGVQATPTPGTQATPTPGAQATPTPTQGQPTPTPTPAQLTPTPTPAPTHTGTVIGHTSQGTNTAQSFSNPADGQGSFLVHLPNGNFVAYEKSCPHAGVAVYYDGGSHHLICPAHGAIFDPANGAKVLQGPANRPLASVSIHINTDGTITVG